MPNKYKHLIVMGKLNNNFTIHLIDETAAKIEELAEYYKRKPCELLRLLLVPVISSEWEKMKERRANNEKIAS